MSNNDIKNIKAKLQTSIDRAAETKKAGRKMETKTDISLSTLATVAEYDYLDSLTFISFYYDNLTAIRRRLPKQSVQFLFSKPTDEIIDRLIADRIDVDIHHAALTAELIERFHAAGLTVNCYTVDNPERGEELALMGVDMITSNILE